MLEAKVLAIYESELGSGVQEGPEQVEEGPEQVEDNIAVVE